MGGSSEVHVFGESSSVWGGDVVRKQVRPGLNGLLSPCTEGHAGPGSSRITLTMPTVLMESL